MKKAVLALVIFLSAAGALVLITHHAAQQNLLVGGVLIAVAIPLMIVSRVQLGSAFSVRPKATTLVTRGIYSKIPHPLFFFLDVALLGLVIAIRQGWLVAAWLALVAVHAWAAAREAKVLARAFGDSYREYRARTWW
jgi:protein-S-isoprenylcysteine O-methyltransferase Ste14